MSIIYFSFQLATDHFKEPYKFTDLFLFAEAKGFEPLSLQRIADFCLINYISVTVLHF